MRPVSAVLAVATLASCGSGDDGRDGREPPGPRPPTKTFRSKHVGFTFDYPKGFAAERRPHQGILGQVSVERGARLNAIKIRRTAGRELGPERYLDEFRRDFERTVDRVEKGRERIGDLEAGVLSFEDSVRRGGDTVEFSSRSYFFKGAGRTWQLECIADDAHRDRIDTACRIALESIDFT